MISKRPTVSVADAKREFSHLLGRVAYGGETILITRRGRPMAKLVPVEEKDSAAPDLANRGWLDEDDPFFEIVGDIVEGRRRHEPRALGPRRRTRPKKGTR